MKRFFRCISYGLCVAIFSLHSACDKLGDEAKTGDDRILLEVSSGQTQTRAASEGNEAAIDHIDVLIFEATGAQSLVCHERKSSLSEHPGTIILQAKRSQFSTTDKYYVYLIANSTAASSEFDLLADLDALKSMEQADRNIHMTDSGIEDMPEVFLMDGAAYEKTSAEPAAPVPVTLNNGDSSADTELVVKLRRAAAKILINLYSGNKVRFNEQIGNTEWYLRNMPYTTTLLAESSDGYTATLRSPATARNVFSRTEDRIVLKAYAYSHSWLDASSLEQQTTLIVNIPITYASSADDRGESANETDYPSNYYRLPISKNQRLERNHYYAVTITVNAPGATNISAPVDLEPLKYEAYDWEDRYISIGGDADRPQYLTVNKEQMNMYESEDANSLIFASSSAVTISLKEAYYYDMLGQRQEVPADIRANITAEIEDGELSGHIEVKSPVPTNNTVRFIVLTIVNETGQKCEVTIRQYPLEYITNNQSWYSYRKDFKTSSETDNTTYQNYVPSRYIGAAWDESSKTWSYSKIPNSDLNWWQDGISSYFFYSKVATAKNDGTSVINAYSWVSVSYSGFGRRTVTNRTSVQKDDNTDLTNARLYHVVISSTSKNYTLGIPRIDQTTGYTDSTSANSRLVSPSFMIASQLGATYPATSLEQAASHCKNYVEVYTDKEGTTHHLDNWRLPTAKEIDIIIYYQYHTDAMSQVLGGNYYWSASGRVENPSGDGIDDDNTSSAYIRCIRDAFESFDFEE